MNDDAVLKALERAGQRGASVAELRAVIGAPPATLSRHLGRLQAEGRVWRPSPKGRVYSAALAPGGARMRMAGASTGRTARPSPRRPARERAARVQSSREDPWYAQLATWYQTDPQGAVALLGFLVAGVVMALNAVSRPGKVRQARDRMLANMEVAEPGFRERFLAFLGVLAVRQRMPATVEEVARGRRDTVTEIVRRNVGTLELTRRQLTDALYATPYDQAVALEVFGFQPVGQLDPVLGLPRYFQPGPGFDFAVFGRLVRPGAVVERSQVGELLRDLLVEVEAAIEGHGVELLGRLRPLPYQVPTRQQALPGRQLTEVERQDRLRQSRAAEARRQEDVARTQAAYHQQLEEEAEP